MKIAVLFFVEPKPYLVIAAPASQLWFLIVSELSYHIFHLQDVHLHQRRRRSERFQTHCLRGEHGSDTAGLPGTPQHSHPGLGVTGYSRATIHLSGVTGKRRPTRHWHNGIPGPGGQRILLAVPYVMYVHFNHHDLRILKNIMATLFFFGLVIVH